MLKTMMYFYVMQVAFRPLNLDIMAFASHFISSPYKGSMNYPGSRMALALNGKFQRLTSCGGIVVVKFRACSRKSTHSQLMRRYRNYNEMDLRCSNKLIGNREQASSTSAGKKVQRKQVSSTSGTKVPKVALLIW